MFWGLVGIIGVVEVVRFVSLEFCVKLFDGVDTLLSVELPVVFRDSAVTEAVICDVLGIFDGDSIVFSAASKNNISWPHTKS